MSARDVRTTDRLHRISFISTVFYFDETRNKKEAPSRYQSTSIRHQSIGRLPMTHFKIRSSFCFQMKRHFFLLNPFFCFFDFHSPCRRTKPSRNETTRSKRKRRVERERERERDKKTTLSSILSGANAFHARLKWFLGKSVAALAQIWRFVNADFIFKWNPTIFSMSFKFAQKPNK